jgi:hypothetical protein
VCDDYEPEMEDLMQERVSALKLLVYEALSY